MNWFFKLMSLMAMVTPDMKTEIKKSIDAMDGAAKASQGDADNVAVGILKALCVILGLYQ